MNNYIAIDPGGNGGLVVINSKGEVTSVIKCPDTDKDILEALRPYKGDAVVYIEKLWGHGGLMGSKASIWTQAENYGKLLMACLAMEMQLHEIPPAKWQKEYSMKKGKDITPKDWKAQLKDRAQKLFPAEKITLWNADALLIARYCYTTECRK